MEKIGDFTKGYHIVLRQAHTRVDMRSGCSRKLGTSWGVESKIVKAWFAMMFLMHFVEALVICSNAFVPCFRFWPLHAQWVRAGQDTPGSKLPMQLVDSQRQRNSNSNHESMNSFRCLCRELVIWYYVMWCVVIWCDVMWYDVMWHSMMYSSRYTIWME